MTTIAFIPARGGSKGIKDKNIKQMLGRPMIHWVLAAADNCREIDQIVVSTDSEKIASVVQCYRHGKDKISVISRSPETASDTATSESAIMEFADNFSEFDTLVVIQATSPMLKHYHLSEALQIFDATDRYDSLLSVVEFDRFLWAHSENGMVKPSYDPLKRPRRQEMMKTYVENGAFYITSREELMRSRCRISGNIGCYIMPKASYHEIDDMEDWRIVESLMIC